MKSASGCWMVTGQSAGPRRAGRKGGSAANRPSSNWMTVSGSSGDLSPRQSRKSRASSAMRSVGEASGAASGRRCANQSRTRDSKAASPWVSITRPSGRSAPQCLRRSWRSAAGDVSMVRVRGWAGGEAAMVAGIGAGAGRRSKCHCRGRPTRVGSRNGGQSSRRRPPFAGPGCPRRSSRNLTIPPKVWILSGFIRRTPTGDPVSMGGQQSTQFPDGVPRPGAIVQRAGRSRHRPRPGAGDVAAGQGAA